MTALEQQRATAQARLNTLMARPPDSSLPPAANVDPAALTESLDALNTAAKAQDPGLQREMAAVRRSQVSTDLARKDYRPDFAIAYMFEQRPQMPDMNGMTFTVNVPVFYRTKQREQVKQAQEEVISAERSRDNRVNELQFELKQQYLAAQAAKQLLDLYTKAVVPQASLALESSISAYEVGNVDFLTMLANFTTVLNYEVDYYRELADYQTALARMEPLVGMELTSALPPDSGSSAEKQKE
jgi:outer membrane protein TolC